MTTIMFPNLQNVPFQAFSQRLLEFEFDSQRSQKIYDLSVILTEFFEMVRVMGTVKIIESFQQLIERSNNLIAWVKIIENQFNESKSDLDSTFDCVEFEALLNHMKIVYQHPLLAAIWLGIEFSKESHNLNAETDFSKKTIVASHYDREMTSQFIELLTLIETHWNIGAIKKFAEETDKSQTINNDTIKQFYVDSSNALFHIASTGCYDLLAASLEIYNHYLTYIDNKRLIQHYNEKLIRIHDKIPKKYEGDCSITSSSPPLFDAHISDSRSKIDLDDINFYYDKRYHQKNILPATIKTLFDKLENNLNFICEFRGEATTYKTRQYLMTLENVLLSEVSRIEQTNTIEVLTTDWLAWIKRIYPGDNILINECITLAAALIVRMNEGEFI